VTSAEGRRERFEASLGFPLDRFQVEAMDALDEGSNVVVAAPTGSGKTVAALYAVERAISQGRRVFYTTPLKALSNQKYVELTRRLGSARVGLLTGDNVTNREAPVVVMTTEVLRNMIYTSSDALDGLDSVVLDEIHYLADATRGPVWEEVIIHLAPSVRVLCLSATVSNVAELAGWVRSVRGPTVEVVSATRPVALENLHMFGDRDADRAVTVPTLIKGRPNPRVAAVRPAARARPGSSGRSTAPLFYTPGRSEVLSALRDAGRLPAIYFVFSRAGCERAAAQARRSLRGLTDSRERSRIDAVAQSHTASLGDDDLAALGFAEWLSGLRAGFAAHHAGLVPQFKEAVEDCFSEGLVKVVFATETLSLGINMPARTVVVESLTKFNGVSHELLTPSEYAQLAGRAGRRGLDPVGYAVTLRSPFVGFDTVAEIVASGDHTLRSSFRPSYNMALNLVGRYTPSEARHLLDLSFAQYRADRAGPPPPPRRAGQSRRRQERDAGRPAPGPDSAGQRHRRSLAVHFDAILNLLDTRGYLSGWKLTDDGHRLARLYHESDLLICESLRYGTFDGLRPAELAAVASGVTYQSRSKSAPTSGPLPDVVANRLAALNATAQELIGDESRLGLAATREPDPGIAGTALRWAGGAALSEVLEDTTLSGGDFVRNMRQLVDLLGQLAAVAPVATTARAAAAARKAVVRGVVEASFELPGSGADYATAKLPGGDPPLGVRRLLV
jgi:superfamily II RNA helicase